MKLDIDNDWANPWKSSGSSLPAYQPTTSSSSSIYSLPNGVYGSRPASWLDHLVGEGTSIDAARDAAGIHCKIEVTDKRITVYNDSGHHQVYNKETGAWDSFIG